MNTQSLVVPSQTMSSREIAELVESRHDNVKVSIERLAERGVIRLPPMQETDIINNLGLPAKIKEYRVCKRDSYIIVAQLSPEFTAKLVDRWQELEANAATPQFQAPQTLSEALLLASLLAAEKEAALTKIEAQQKTISVKDDLIKASNEASIKAGEILIREFVKSVDIIDLGERQFFAWMRGQKIVFSDRNEPYQHYVNAGYFTYKPSEELINGKLRYTMRVTPRGKVWLAAKYMAYLDAASVAVLDGGLPPRNGLVLLQGAQA